MIQLVTVRVDNESAKVKGELATARKQTDEAIRKAYDILNAFNVVQPSAALTQLTTVLFGIEDRAKLYYISGGKTGGSEPTPVPRICCPVREGWRRRNGHLPARRGHLRE